MTMKTHGKALTIDTSRSAERSIPEVTMPALSELGLGETVMATRRTRILFAARPLIAIVAFVAFWLAGWWPVALATVPLLYGLSLATIHHLIHGSLGFGRRQRSLLLVAVSLLLTESGHSLRRTHLAHHGTDPDAEDPEGYIETLGWRRLLVEAPLFRYRLWLWARRNPVVTAGEQSSDEARSRFEADERRRHVEIAWHLLANAVAASLLVLHLAGPGLGRLGAMVVVYVGLQHLANAVFAILAAKGPHTNWGRPTPTPLIAVRGRLTGYLLFGHIWHLEHHFYPQVPLTHLGPVAEALAEEFVARDVLIVRVP